jgi:hypothetical protein
MTEKLSIAKLQGAENYATWSSDLRLILCRNKNWSLVDGADVMPPPTHISDPSFTTSQLPTISNPDLKKWIDHSIDVLYKIQLTCEEPVKYHICHLEVPATVWKTLHDLYEPKGASMQSTLVKKDFLHDACQLHIHIQVPCHN